MTCASWHWRTAPSQARVPIERGEQTRLAAQTSFDACPPCGALAVCAVPLPWCIWQLCTAPWHAAVPNAFGAQTWLWLQTPLAGCPFINRGSNTPVLEGWLDCDCRRWSKTPCEFCCATAPNESAPAAASVNVMMAKALHMARLPSLFLSAQ